MFESEKNILIFSNQILLEINSLDFSNKIIWYFFHIVVTGFHKNDMLIIYGVFNKI